MVFPLGATLRSEGTEATTTMLGRRIPKTPTAPTINTMPPYPAGDVFCDSGTCPTVLSGTVCD